MMPSETLWLSVIHVAIGNHVQLDDLVLLLAIMVREASITVVSMTLDSVENERH